MDHINELILSIGIGAIWFGLMWAIFVAPEKRREAREKAARNWYRCSK